MVKPSGSEEERGFQALLEQIEGKVEAFGDQVLSLGQKIETVGSELDGRIVALDGKIDLHTRTILSSIEDLAGKLRMFGSQLDAHERTHRS